MEVLDIVNEVESGKYPASEWVERAPLLVGQFFFADASYAPGNLDQVIDAYHEFVRTHFVLNEQNPLGNGIGFIITTKMADLFERKGEGFSGVEHEFEELERDIPNVAGLEYLRAQFYMSRMDSVPAPERPALYQKAIDTLTLLHAQNNGLYSRKALATLASLYFLEGDVPSARENFAKYVTAYPQAAWSWVAALRIGQSDEALGDSKGAVDSYLAAASKHPSVPLALVLGHAYAGRNYEALGQFDLALREYQTALAGWDRDYGSVYSLHVPPDRESTRPLLLPDNPEVSRQALSSKIAQLKTSVSIPGGLLLERGRWFVEHGRHEEALVPLEQFLTRYRHSSVVPEAAYLVHRARIGSALALVDVENPNRDEAAALAEFDAVTSGSYDFGVCAAKIAKASILWKSGASAAAESLMNAALKEWQDQQGLLRQKRRDNIERDIAEIRELVIRPNGERALGGVAGSTISKRPPASFVIVNPDVEVKFANGESGRRSVYQSLPGVDHVVFLSLEQQSVLASIVAKVDGEPAQDRTVPSIDILDLWNKFFPAERRMGGVVFETYPGISFETPPTITDIEFLDGRRTKAAVRIVVGHEGGTVVLEKVKGIWTVKGLVNSWIAQTDDRGVHSPVAYT